MKRFFRRHTTLSLPLLLAGTLSLTLAMAEPAHVPDIVQVSSYEQAQRLTGVRTQPTRIIPAYWHAFPSGPRNDMTDVPGVTVGQVSLLREQPPQLRTGVTAIVPQSPLNGGNLANTGFHAGVSVLNGNGEMTGLSGIQHSGLLNGPIILTNTASVGIAHQGVWEYFETFFPGQWEGELPVIAECWDGFFNSMHVPALRTRDVIAAIRNASAQPVLQGRIGAGTGMRSFGLHGGIGSASRKLRIEDKQYTLGVLVNSNHSQLNDLNPLLKTALEAYWQMPLEQIKARDAQDRAQTKPTPHRQGSIIIIIATDLPLDAHALQQLAQHAAIGIGQAGGKMSTTSGDFALAFSTANAVLMNDQAPAFHTFTSLNPQALTPVFNAAIEAIVEAQLNVLVASHNVPVTLPGTPQADLPGPVRYEPAPQSAPENTRKAPQPALSAPHSAG